MRNYEHEKVVLFQVIVLTVFQLMKSKVVRIICHILRVRHYANQTHQNKCAFCRGNHWSDKCKVISEPEARKEYLRKGSHCFLCLNQSHISRNCSKQKHATNAKVCTIPQFVLRKRIVWKSWETLLTKPTRMQFIIRHLFYYKQQKYS